MTTDRRAGSRGREAGLRVVPGRLDDDLPADFLRPHAVRASTRQRPRAKRASDARPTRIAVVGGGIAGLAAAWNLVGERGASAEVTVFEADDAVGGKLRVGEVGGVPVDEGAESMLATRPEGVALARAVGLGSDVVPGSGATAAVLARGALRPLPTGLISGIPTDLRVLAASGIMSLRGLLRIPLDHWLPRTAIDHDVSVGDYVATRIGTEVVDKLVEPMLAGVYAGRAEDLSLEMTLPALARLARRERSLITAARMARATGATAAGARRGPAFVSIDGGMGRLPQAVGAAVATQGVSIETGARVTQIRADGTRWRVTVRGSGAADRRVDGIVLAVPAIEAARLLRKANPHAAAALDTIDYASVAIVTMAHRTDSVPAGLRGSGFLVPTSAGLTVKAATFSSLKWPWLAERGAALPGSGVAVFRASVGRFGDVGALQLDDAELVRVVAGELSPLTGVPSVPFAARVTRWPSAMPQYAVGHRARVARIRELLTSTPGLAVCGAAYDGVGVPACVGSAQLAVGHVLGDVRDRGEWSGQ